MTADALGPPARVHRLDDEASGLVAFFVLDDLSLGPAFGGIRMRGYRDDREAREDAAGLARQMTLKCSFAELDAGGGKAVVRADRLVDRARACRVLGDFVESLGGEFRTAGDFGTTRTDLERIAERTRYVVDPADLELFGEASAVGLEAAVTRCAARLGFDGLDGVRVLVQGVGDIGGPLARRLARSGARVTVADPDPVAIDRLRATAAVDVVPPDRALSTETDVLAPCAVGGVLDLETARRLPARAVVPGANRVLASERAGDLLWERGVLVAPDFVVNAGAVIRGALDVLRGAPAREDELAAIGERLDAVFDDADRWNLPPERVAIDRAVARVLSSR
ncbi:MAG: Glu/Leu/Phe/Val dehydrogenase dimerization domain-containing protein [Planctomycetota bacterium JB042]